jgi:hypothetical protein
MRAFRHYAFLVRSHGLYMSFFQFFKHFDTVPAKNRAKFFAGAGSGILFNMGGFGKYNRRQLNLMSYAFK